MAYINGNEVLFVVDHANHLRKLAEGATTEIPADALKGATIIADYAFKYWRTITSVAIPETVLTIGREAFINCTGLTSVTIAPSVTEFGIISFKGCTGLVSVTLPSSTKRLHLDAFYGCTSLATLRVEATKPPILDTGVFGGCTALARIEVPAGSGSAYKTATNWSAYADIITEA